MTNFCIVRRALLSVSDKRGLAAFARGLAAMGIELVSTGGTAAALRADGLVVRDVSELTGFPEIMDGRVKTLHPGVHGGLLAKRDDPTHQAAVAAHDISLIDLLVVNLYPFRETLARGAARDEIVENIDIGGPAMIRAAAKNHGDVAVLTDPADYDLVLEALQAQKAQLDQAMRTRLAGKAYRHTADYDAAIATWFENTEQLTLHGTLAQALRYGENPHQSAAVYRVNDGRVGVLDAVQAQGKELSYNNINDADAALEAVSEFAECACVIVKHANPCGVATASSQIEAWNKALACDPVSAFGGIVAFNRSLDAPTAEALSQLFLEVIIAPGADETAKRILAAKKNLRLLLLPNMPTPDHASQQVKTIAGGLLVQSRDTKSLQSGELKVVTKLEPTAQQLEDLQFAFRVAKHVKSNAIVLVKNGATVGIGAGQMSRVDSTRIAGRKSLDSAEAQGLTRALSQGAVAASDAFFPFADGIEALAATGVVAIIQPGGSLKDDEVIAAADRLGLAMVLTGQRHFRH